MKFEAFYTRQHPIPTIAQWISSQPFAPLNIVINIPNAKHNGTSYVTWLRSNLFKISAMETLSTIHMMKHPPQFWLFAYQKLTLLTAVNNSFKYREVTVLWTPSPFKLHSFSVKWVIVVEKKNNIPSSYTICWSVHFDRHEAISGTNG